MYLRLQHTRTTKEIYGIEAFRVINGVDFGKISIAQHPEIGRMASM